MLPNGWIIQLFVAPANGNWSLTLTKQDMGTCVIGSGLDWTGGGGDV